MKIGIFGIFATKASLKRHYIFKKQSETCHSIRFKRQRLTFDFLIWEMRLFPFFSLFLFSFVKSSYNFYEYPDIYKLHSFYSSCILRKYLLKLAEVKNRLVLAGKESLVDLGMHGIENLCGLILADQIQHLQNHHRSQQHNLLQQV